MSRSKRIAAGAMSLGLVLASLPAIAQDSLDDLERRLNAARKAEAGKQEAARSAAAARSAQQARMAVLVIRADAPCRLSIDGESRTVLKAQEAHTLDVLGGKQLIDCESTEETGIRISQVQELPAGSKEVVLLKLATEVSGRREARESTERERAERLKQEQTAAKEADRERRETRAGGAGYLARWTDRSNGILADSETGLQWTQVDNGKDVDWNEALMWCNGLGLDGVGWRLPTMEELHAIHNRHIYLEEKDGAFSARVSPLFRLSGLWFWSGTQSGSSAAWSVLLRNGGRLSSPVTYRDNARALCVRSS